MLHDPDHLAAYLLGELSEVETEAVDEALVADDALAEAIRAALAELYDEYAAGALVGARQQAFERRFLATADGRERLAFSEALAAAAARAARRPGVLARLRAHLAGPRGAVLGAAACAAVLALVLLARGGGEAPDSVELILAPTELRGAGDTPTLPSAGHVRLILELPPGDEHPRYEVRAGDRALGAEREGDRLVVAIEAGALAPGRQQLELIGVGAGGEVEPLAYYEIVVPAD